MKDIKIILLLFFLASIAKAQSDSALARDAEGKTLKRLGKNALKQNDPASAITFLEAYLKNNRKDAGAMMLLGRSYNAMRDFAKAQKIYLQAYQTGGKKVPEALFYHAQMQKSNGQYDSAKVNFQKFKKEYKGPEKLLKRQAVREISFCDSVQSLIARDRKIIIQVLDTGINKINTDGAPVNLDDSTLLFSSVRTEKKEYIIEGDSNGIRKKLYYAKRGKNKWEFMGEFGSGINDPRFNTGNPSLSPDRKRLYFSRCRLNYKEEMICAIYVSEKKGEEWSEPVKLSKLINRPKYTSTMPTVASNPANGADILYFVSNNKKGRGGMDIWYSVFDKKLKKFKEPKNGGSKINTAQDEISPFFDNETRTLYFSSDAPGGLGGFDIYKSTGDGKKWTGSENIGFPMNSGADESFYTISTNREEGFFVSNRKGGNALKNNPCCDDIYYYKHSEYIHIHLKGMVADLLDENQGIPDANIEIYIRDVKTDEKFLVKTVTTDTLGNYSAKLETGKEYFLIVKTKDFLNKSEAISTMGVTSSRDIRAKFRVTRKPKEAVKIADIQYEFGKADLTEASKKAIDLTLLEMMRTNPELIIEVQAHTDNKGNDTYNQKLSQKRADNIVSYLVGKGIPPDRLKPMGYGESKPLTANENPDGSDNPEGRARNRRTEFKIIGMVEEESVETVEPE